MAFFCPSVIGRNRKPASSGKLKVYTMKKARKRKLHTLNALLPGGGGETELGFDQQDEDDSDSGISQVYNPVSTYSRAQFSLPDIAKTELASKLLAATPTHPAHIKARVLWKYNAVERTDLQVEKGEIILLLYREKNKVYVVNSKGKSGFIPFNYCTVLRKNDFVSNVYHPQSERTNYKQCSWQVNGCHHEFVDASYYSRTAKTTNSHIHRSRSEESLYSRNDNESLNRKISSSLEDLSDDNQIATMISDLIHWDRKAPETFRRRQKVQVSHFRKFENEVVMVLFDFHAADENDVDVQRGEVVTVLNRDDQDWWWVMRDDGLEGFIPSSYVSIEAVRMSPECTPRSTDSSLGSSEGSINQVRFQDPLCTIHSYEIEHSDSDSLVPNETHDSDNEEMYMDSKWSTWC
ncbi:SH3 domain-containing protein Dlish-like isoform X1 [Stylophora pistillata]|uniref:Tyrosine-protein kinase Tec n=1 Tax=Stylophora pistillata TaxID=50429 RepID=A0A2B4SFJ1_STYPI|nr:SH3 domain-containing protein Dlish-like isoform X1 [Stylophora pistillata]XP_022787812.1 SH3 domain-containing protein Dlish-like isoform X1 [Stylophora pistillata]PFX27302.1 Tyrosine-protein kinase Tec [Stylophora pistillata]